MTIEEIAKAWADLELSDRPYDENTRKSVADSYVRQSTKFGKYLLTSLLEELPVDDEDTGDPWEAGWREYERQIKSLIQTKLK